MDKAEMQVGLKGSFFVSKRDKKNAPEVMLEQGSETVKVMVLHPDTLQFPVYAKRGETVSLGDFEFARIDVTVTSFGYLDEQDAHYAECERIAGLLVMYESAKIRARNSKDVQVELPELKWNGPESDVIIVEYAYGMTVSVAEREYGKCDAGRGVPCIPADLQKTVIALQEWLKGRIVAALKSVRESRAKSMKEFGF